MPDDPHACRVAYRGLAQGRSDFPRSDRPRRTPKASLNSRARNHPAPPGKSSPVREAGGRFWAVSHDGNSIMYAIIVDGGRQYKVSEGQQLVIDYRDASSGDGVKFDKVVAFSDGSNLQLGTPRWAAPWSRPPSWASCKAPS